MGRRARGFQGDGALRIGLRHVRINSGGYDAGGAYWGLGAPLWYCYDAETAGDQVAAYFRAKDREAAKAHVLEKLPEATFYR